MASVSISQLKMSPAKAIAKASDYPLVVESRNKVKAYLVGKELYEKIIVFVEDYIDQAAVKGTDFSKGKDFEKVAKELGL